VLPLHVLMVLGSGTRRWVLGRMVQAAC
jgi:hypothetical protein